MSTFSSIIIIAIVSSLVSYDCQELIDCNCLVGGKHVICHICGGWGGGGGGGGGSSVVYWEGGIPVFQVIYQNKVEHLS